MEASSPSGWIHALENAILAFALAFAAFMAAKRKRDTLLPVAFITLALLECVLVGYTAPNAGAIFRYRAPSAVFIVMAALYLFPPRAPKSASQ